ncbi:MAG TPA: peptidoglycan-associated lipoprotein Pal [Sulfurivirga caldicuralii]|nr:peptidoglycan-associated lipoprotein Pal [Sulfurivirga caldicuralii]
MKKWIYPVFALGVSGVLSGCSSTPDKPVAAPVEPVSAAEQAAGERGGLPVNERAGHGVEVIPIEQLPEASAGALSADEVAGGQVDDNQQAALDYPPVVYFDYDSDVVSEAGRDVLKYYAQKLLAQPEIQVRLEGHTDERGSPEYNLALGERRAKAVKEVLMLYGVDAARMQVISYGEARPAVDGHDESAWAKNRRVELVFVQ